MNMIDGNLAAGGSGKTSPKFTLVTPNKGPGKTGIGASAREDGGLLAKKQPTIDEIRLNISADASALIRQASHSYSVSSDLPDGKLAIDASNNYGSGNPVLDLIKKGLQQTIAFGDMTPINGPDADLPTRSGDTINDIQDAARESHDVGVEFVSEVIGKYVNAGLFIDSSSQKLAA